MNKLQSLFAELRALDWCHRAAHWQSSGSTSYQEHLLFERLYGNTVEEIDTFAEKLVGTYGNEAVAPLLGVVATAWYIKAAGVAGDSVSTALEAEERFLRHIQGVMDSEDLSVGMENFLGGVADKHETHTYLLKQHLIDVPLETEWGPTLVEE